MEIGWNMTICQSKPDEPNAHNASSNKIHQSILFTLYQNTTNEHRYQFAWFEYNLWGEIFVEWIKSHLSFYQHTWVGKLRYCNDELDNAIVATVKRDMMTYVVMGILEKKKLCSILASRLYLFTFFLWFLPHNIQSRQKCWRAQIDKMSRRDHVI